jgi:hypothetical protein
MLTEPGDLHLALLEELICTSSDDRTHGWRTEIKIRTLHKIVKGAVPPFF